MTAQVAGMTGTGGTGAATIPTASRSVAEFVCEEDVQQAIALGRTILIGERTIVTPLARDLGQQHKVLVQAGWRS
jgi:hypothetical protein